jgi:cardiolipin synthase
MLARRLGQTTRLGAILDPIADKALIICAVVLLSLPESAVPGAAIGNWVVVAVVGKDLWVIGGFVVIYLVTDRFRVAPTPWGKASTCGQLVMVVLVLASPDLNAVLPGQAGSHAAMAAQWVVAALSVAAVVSYTRLGLSFVAQHDKPLDNHGNQAGQRRTDAQH